MTDRDYELLIRIRSIVRDELQEALVGRRSNRLTIDDRSRLLALLPIIAGLLGSEPWTVRELIAVATEPRGFSLRTALGTLNAMQFGKLLRRARDEPIGSYVVERICDSGRDGALWRVLGDSKVALGRDGR